MSTSSATKKNTDGSLIIVVLDRSGSMSSCKAATDKGLAEFIKGQAATSLLLKDSALISLYEFDDRYDVVYENVPIAQAPKHELIPRGSTALQDAIGRTILRVKAQLHGRHHKPAVRVLIVSDGYENSSSEHTAESNRKLIENRVRKGWDFSYLGANQDAILTARTMGIPVRSSMTYETSNTGLAFAAAGANFTRSRVTGQGLAYNDDERQQAVKGAQ